MSIFVIFIRKEYPFIVQLVCTSSGSLTLSAQCSLVDQILYNQSIERNLDYVKPLRELRMSYLQITQRKNCGCERTVRHRWKWTCNWFVTTYTAH